jgi:hypothetical protein
MPTLEEIMELEYECCWEDGYVNGVEGVFAIGPNGNSIFIPFAGYRDYSGLSHEGYSGYLWSGTSSEYHDYDAFSLVCNWRSDYWGREYGFSVRPVSD